MKSKFKAGDLVMLSAAGRKTQQNEELLGGFGFIETINESQMDAVRKISNTDLFPIKTKWWTKDLKLLNMNFKPYELKFFKNK